MEIMQHNFEEENTFTFSPESNNTVHEIEDQNQQQNLTDKIENREVHHHPNIKHKK